VALKKCGRDLFADAGPGMLIVPGDSPEKLRDKTIDSGRSNGRSPGGNCVRDVAMCHIWARGVRGGRRHCAPTLVAASK
jgi:hypothetical protein